MDMIWLCQCRHNLIIKRFYGQTGSKWSIAFRYDLRFFTLFCEYDL